MRGYIDATDGQGGLAPTPHGRSTFEKNVGRKKGSVWEVKCPERAKFDENVGNLGNDHSILHVLISPDVIR